MVEEKANCGLHGICAQPHIWDVEGCIMIFRSTAMGMWENEHRVAGNEAYDNDTQYLSVTETLFEDLQPLIFNLCIGVLFLLNNCQIFEFSTIEIG